MKLRIKESHVFIGVIILLLLYTLHHNHQIYNKVSKTNKHVTFNDEIVVYSSDSEEDDDVPKEPRRYYDSRYYPRKAMRINVPTRGEPPSYQQVGLLQDTDDSQNVKPLYGRQTYPGSNQWNYFTSTDSHLATKIPVELGSRDCTDEHGCKELQKNEKLHVLDKDYNVNIYGTIAPRYIPY